MKVIGITGGAGAGKSSILAYVQEMYDAYICQADQVAKNLQKKGTGCYKKVVEHFGCGILTESESLDREKLAQIVFSDEGQLKALNAIVHPAVKERVQKLCAEGKKGGRNLFLLEAALLLEDHYEDFCDEIWYVYAEEELRRQRLLLSRGYSGQKIDALFQVQLKKEEFLARCDRAIDNSNTFEETCIQVDEMMNAIGIPKVR